MSELEQPNDKSLLPNQEVLRDSITLWYFIVSIIGMISENTIQIALVRKFSSYIFSPTAEFDISFFVANHGNVLSQNERFILDTLLNHIGNVSNGLILLAPLVVGNIYWELTDERLDSQVIKHIRRYWSFFVITAFVVLLLDTETVQLLPLSFGVPDLKDIPAGLFGMVAAALVTDSFEKYQREMNTKTTGSEKQ